MTGGLELTLGQIERIFKSQVQERSIAHWNNEKNKIECRRERSLGAIVLTSGPDPKPDPAVVLEHLTEKALEKLGELLPSGFLERAQFAQVKVLSEEVLRETAGIWLNPLLENRRDLQLSSQQFAQAALAQLDWQKRQRLDQTAPTHFSSPAGTGHVIDYAGDDAPSVEVRVQALFGLDQHPMIGHTPLLLKLTSPAGRPIQSTRDLPVFWRGSWADVAKDMKGRYPKHRWPDEPWLEKPSLKTKNAFNRS
ncbi:MAG: ATP-dependent helicase C-terminal domain-containing protein [Pseudomonadota bacterium]